MRASGPYEVRPRQLRVLVLLLVLLPLLPLAFVVRFVVDDVAYEYLDAHERARPVYQRFLDAATDGLSLGAVRQLTLDPPADMADPWRIVRERLGAVDTVFITAPDGRLSLAPDDTSDHATSRQATAASLSRTLLNSGVHYATPPRSGPVRWRFLSENPEPTFCLQPRTTNASPPAAGEGALLLVKTRKHLLEQIAEHYRRELGPGVSLYLKDESGENQLLAGSVDISGTRGDTPLARTLLPPPLPAWQIELFSPDIVVSGLARGQIAFYWWSFAGMFAATAGIAGAAGWALTRRISLHELSNDALAIVSHEMKTPLASIRLLVETLLARRYRGGLDAADEYLRLISGENARLERLVESFQTLTRLESMRAGRTRLNLAPVRAGEIVEAAGARLAGRLEAPGCAYLAAGDLDAPPFSADHEALVAVLVNLLDNALKYSGDEKCITLRTADAPDRVTFEVSDNGVGIAPGEQHRVFERFYQSDHRLSRRHDGCGLGLNIVRSAVKAHGGNVSLHSTPGKGSTFTVCIPKKGVLPDLD